MFQDKQLFLLACALAARTDVDGVRQVYNYVSCQADGDVEGLRDAVCYWWPELSDCMQLEFLFNSEVVGEEPVVVDLLEAHNDLIPVVEMGIDEVGRRYKVVRSKVEHQLASPPTWSSWQGRWMYKRILHCNKFDPTNSALQYKKLWEKVVPQTLCPEFYQWVDGVVWTSHFLELSIAQLMQLPPQHILSSILGSHTAIGQLVPYLNYFDAYDVFWDNFCNDKEININGNKNYQLFEKLFHLLHKSKDIPKAQCVTYQKTFASIIFYYTRELLNYMTLDQLDENFLVQLDPSITIFDGISVAQLLKYAEVMKNCNTLQDYSLKDLHTISLEEKTAQLAHFESFLKNEIAIRDMHILQQNYALINEGKFHETVVTKLDIDEQISVFLEILLQFGEFTFLNTFCQSGKQLDNEIIIKQFWKSFKNASNGNKSRPEMIKCHKTLQLLSSKESHLELYKLIELVDELSYYKLNMGKGVIFKPCNVLDFVEAPLDLIRKLLELNDALYTKVDTTYGILYKMLESFLVPKIDSNKLRLELQILHVDSALTKNDFEFAYSLSREILEDEEFEKIKDNSWVTIFQVGKYNEPQWMDTEIPTDVVVKEMTILSLLLGKAPLESVENITIQWSGLEVELSTRDISTHQGE